MKKITKVQKKAYLVCGGVNCPICLSEDIENTGTPQDNDDGTTSQEVTCSSCQNIFIEKRKITDIELADD